MAKLHSASPREITSPFTCEIISELHSKDLLIVCLIKCLLIFQDSYMRKGDMTTFLCFYSGHLDYIHIHMNTFVGLHQTTLYVLLMFQLFE